MGFLDTQRKKTDARIRVATEGRLEPGEEITTAFLALNRFRWWIAALVLFPIIFYFEYSGTERPWWLVGALLGGYLVAVMRQYYVVLTDRRLLVLLLRRLSARVVTSEDAVPRSQVTAEFREGLLNGRLALRAGDRDYDLQVGRPFADRARAFAASVTEPQRAD